MRNEWVIIEPDQIEEHVAKGWNIDAQLVDDAGNTDHLSLLQSCPDVCDFCSLADGIEVVFEVPAITSDMLFEKDDADNLGPRLTFEANYTPDWNACAVCAPMVRARDLDGIWRRVSAAMGIADDPPEIRDQLRFAFRELHQAVFDMITGERPL